MLHSRKLTGRNRTWTLHEDVVLVEHGDIPASYVSLLEGSMLGYNFFPGKLVYKSNTHRFITNLTKYILTTMSHQVPLRYLPKHLKPDISFLILLIS